MKTYTVIFSVDGLPFKKQISANTEDQARQIAMDSFKVVKVQDGKEVLERVKSHQQ